MLWASVDRKYSLGIESKFLENKDFSGCGESASNFFFYLFGKLKFTDCATLYSF